MEDYKQSKAYLEAKEQNDSKNRLSAEMQEKLDTLLKKSPADIKHEEMMFVLENMDLQSLFNAAAKRQNEQIINLNDEQKN
jgi:acetyl/propionyl-CoA carboxylase alpha subunit